MVKWSKSCLGTYFMTAGMTIYSKIAADFGRILLQHGDALFGATYMFILMGTPQAWCEEDPGFSMGNPWPTEVAPILVVGCHKHSACIVLHRVASVPQADTARIPKCHFLPGLSSRLLNFALGRTLQKGARSCARLTAFLLASLLFSRKRRKLKVFPACKEPVQNCTSHHCCLPSSTICIYPATPLCKTTTKWREKRGSNLKIPHSFAVVSILFMTVH